MLQGVPIIMAPYTSTIKTQTGLAAALTNVCVRLPPQILIIIRRIHKHVILVILVRLTRVLQVLSEQDPLAVVVVLVIHNNVRFVFSGQRTIVDLVNSELDRHAAEPVRAIHKPVIPAVTVAHRTHAHQVSTDQVPRVVVLVRQIHKPVARVPVVRLTPVQLENSNQDHLAMVWNPRIHKNVPCVSLVARPTRALVVHLNPDPPAMAVAVAIHNCVLLVAMAA